MTCPLLSPTMTMSRLQPAAEAGRPPSGLAARARQLIRRRWRAYWDRRARKATVLLLQALDERTLRDIGIGPGEIESLVYCRGDDRQPGAGVEPHRGARIAADAACHVLDHPGGCDPAAHRGAGERTGDQHRRVLDRPRRQIAGGGTGDEIGQLARRAHACIPRRHG